MSKIYTAIGTMSGTSCDGIDVSIINTDGFNYIKLLYSYFFPYDESFVDLLININREKIAANDILYIQKKITVLHSEAINNAIVNSTIDAESIELIGFHGHTIVHRPDINMTWQLGSPILLASLCNKIVISNFREFDMTQGGQGAPLVPIFHKALFSENLNSKEYFIVNIGGISNITYCNNDKVYSTDVGPGNCLLDDIVQSRFIDAKYDKEGSWALKGIIDYLFANKYVHNFVTKYNKGSSFDRNEFTCIDFNNMNIKDALATASYITSSLIGKYILSYSERHVPVIVVGGGRKNTSIIQNLENILDRRIINIDNMNIDGDFVESSAFAYLGIRSYLDLPYIYDNYTGLIKSSLGGVTYYNKIT